jgi:NADPH:quinone reductase-like Zn-dependent oxidoreductase
VQVIQLSKLYGFKTINIVRSDKAANELKELGADVIINTSADDIGAKIKEV